MREEPLDKNSILYKRWYELGAHDAGDEKWIPHDGWNKSALEAPYNAGYEHESMRKLLEGEINV